MGKELSRRPTGAGSISKRADGRWQASWPEWTPKGRKRRYVYGSTKEVVEQKMRLRRGDVLPEEINEECGDTVYFIQAFSGGPVKIGVSTNVRERLKTLQLACPIALKVIHVIPHADISYERKLHKRFARYRLHGEWFDASRELLDCIQEFKKLAPNRQDKRSGIGRVLFK